MEPENPTSAPEVPSNQQVTLPDGESGHAPEGATPPPTGFRAIFMGPQGLRAGWSLAIFALLFGGPIAGMTAFVHYVQKVAPEMVKTPTQGLNPPSMVASCISASSRGSRCFTTCLFPHGPRSGGRLCWGTSVRGPC